MREANESKHGLNRRDALKGVGAWTPQDEYTDCPEFCGVDPKWHTAIGGFDVGAGHDVAWYCGGAVGAFGQLGGRARSEDLGLILASP